MDPGHIQEEDAGFVNRRNQIRGEPPAVPLYTQKRAEQVKQCFQPVVYDQPFEPVKEVRTFEHLCRVDLYTLFCVRLLMLTTLYEDDDSGRVGRYLDATIDETIW
jgi:hypothetical protein